MRYATSTLINCSYGRKAGVAKMDINKASAEELERAFEVDGERSRYIIDKRNQLGGFDSWDQLKEAVPSIEDRMIENLQAAGLTIGPKQHGKEKQHQPERQGESRQSSSSTASGAEKDVNTVSREELERVCQIDGERADYFLGKRRELGGFTSWEQIKEAVPSFDDGMIRRLKNAGFGFDSDSQAA